MNWKSAAVLVAGGVLTFIVCFYQVPTAEKATVLVDCVQAIANIFRINFWICLSIVLGMICLFLSFWLQSQKKSSKSAMDFLEKQVELQEQQIEALNKQIQDKSWLRLCYKACCSP